MLSGKGVGRASCPAPSNHQFLLQRPQRLPAGAAKMQALLLWTSGEDEPPQTLYYPLLAALNHLIRLCVSSSPITSVESTVHSLADNSPLTTPTQLHQAASHWWVSNENIQTAGALCEKEYLFTLSWKQVKPRLGKSNCSNGIQKKQEENQK